MYDLMHELEMTAFREIGLFSQLLEKVRTVKQGFQYKLQIFWQMIMYAVSIMSGFFFLHIAH